MTKPLRHDFAPWPASDVLNASMAAEHDGTCLLSFSCGKDSLATWLELRRHFTRIVPVFCYLVPRLVFIEDSIRYYEDRFETRVVRMPHSRLYDWLATGLFQSPGSARAGRQADLPKFSMDDVFRTVREDMALPGDTPTAIGVLASDTPMRRAAVRKTGPRNRTRNTWFPLYDWTGAARYETIRESGVALPVDYQLFGRSFDGLQPLYLAPIRERYPDDYATILQWFPLAGAALERHAIRQRHSNRTGATI